jgi:hypothetical protein
MPRVRICHADRYQSRLTIADRVQVFESGRWRAATADELDACTRREDSTTGDLSVFAIPKHLLKRWWDLAESGDSVNINPGFEHYARELAEYFNYKSWDLPSDAVMEIVVSSSEHAAEPQPLHATQFNKARGRLHACINLGEENSAISLGAQPADVRVILEPGEGVMFPNADVLWSRSTVGSSDLSVTLLIGSIATD